MFGVGPAYLFIIRQRLPFGLMRSGWQPWVSTMATNIAIAALVAIMIWLIGVVPFLVVHLPIMLIAASVGVWLFYVQHQFEDTEWAYEGTWTLHEVALHGSSYYDLPSVIRWFTANIGIHHIHHLCSRIPYYRLPLVLRDYPDLGVIGRLTLVQSFRCVRLVLWDEGQQRLVSFREVRQRHALGSGRGGGRLAILTTMGKTAMQPQKIQCRLRLPDRDRLDVSAAAVASLGERKLRGCSRGATGSKRSVSVSRLRHGNGHCPCHAHSVWWGIRRFNARLQEVRFNQRTPDQARSMIQVR